ncbi:MAG: transcription antitermination factor NusB [Paludibacteraceae bacterium]|jgi:N utilization substance protein B|nr:transcription antitermination factor NusB [Paludibacteraceae bacterium]MED9996005.1 transcription antitermination factor NusB [Paludibacteraceae bacterium]
MINRVLIRTKVIQLLYAYRNNRESNNVTTAAKQAEQALLLSVNQTYELYHWILMLMVELHQYAIKRIEIGLNKLRPTAEERNPNTHFINNLFSKQLIENKQLKEFAEKHGISWSEETDLIKLLTNKITATDFYQEYMQENERSYERDKQIWRQILKKVLIPSTILEERLEEINLYWNDDFETVMSFVEKTIKRFQEGNGADQPLLEMFRDQEDLAYAKKLLRTAIVNQEEYDALIEKTAQNWETERIAAMDMVIMQAALAEIYTFPTIPINVTLNEFIEISKYYSTEKSSTFINGILDKIATDLRAEGKLIKAGIYVKED